MFYVSSDQSQVKPSGINEYRIVFYVSSDQSQVEPSGINEYRIVFYVSSDQSQVEPSGINEYRIVFYDSLEEKRRGFELTKKRLMYKMKWSGPLTRWVPHDG